MCSAFNNKIILFLHFHRFFEIGVFIWFYINVWLLFLLNLPRSPTPFSLTREEKVTITSKTSLVLSSLQICIQILSHISVLFPKNRPECPSDKYTQCFLEVTATIGTCALGIVGSLTIEGWFSVSFFYYLGTYSKNYLCFWFTLYIL